MKSENEKEKEKKEKQLRTDIDQEETELDVLKYFEEAGFSTKSSEEYNGEAKYYRIFRKKINVKITRRIFIIRCRLSLVNILDNKYNIIM